jgi:6-phosphogluconolactonase
MSFLVHVSSTESREIHAFRLDAGTGSLELLEAIDVPGAGAPTRGNIPLVWSRDRRVLYAQIRIEPFPLSAFAIDPASGKLTLIETVAMPAPLAYLSITRNGRFLLGASYDGALLTMNRLDTSGRVAVPCVQTLPTPPKAHCIVEATFGGFVYATSVEGEAILAYRLDDTSGRLTEASPAVTATRPGSGPRHLVFHPALDRVYCVNEHAGSVAVYSVDRNSGALTELQYESIVPADFSGRALGSDLHLTPDGALLYASVRKTHTIAVFRVDPATGLLSRAGTAQVEASPRGFAIEPNGRFLLCAGQESNHVAVYAIDAVSGELTVAGRYPVGKRPSWIEIVPAHVR